jgi:CBS domain-containing protein
MKRGCIALRYARAVATLGELMSRDVIAVAPEDTLGEAAERMAGKDVGSAVVLEHGRLIGILTERDILRAVAGRVHSSEARVREWMTADPVTAGTETTGAEALDTMMGHGFRHLPVVDGERTLGIVSIRDVMRADAQTAFGARKVSSESV